MLINLTWHYILDLLKALYINKSKGFKKSIISIFAKIKILII